MVCKSLVNKEKKMKRQSLCSRKAKHVLQRHQASQQCKLLQRRDSRPIQYAQSHLYFSVPFAGATCPTTYPLSSDFQCRTCLKSSADAEGGQAPLGVQPDESASLTSRWARRDFSMQRNHVAFHEIQEASALMKMLTVKCASALMIAQAPTPGPRPSVAESMEREVNRFQTSSGASTTMKVRALDPCSPLAIPSNSDSDPAQQ